LNASVLVYDDRGERTFRGEDFPLDIGGGNAAIHLADTDSAVLAQVGIDDGTPFLVPGDVPMRINGTLRREPSWLADGDVVSFNEGHLVCHVRGKKLSLHARSHQAEELPPPSIGDDRGRTVIEPVAFHPERGQVRSSRRGMRVLQVAILAVVALLTAVTWFMFTARSVNVIIQPPPAQMALGGALLKPRVGGRYLLRPGDYQVTAELDGYEYLEADIEVGRSSNQQFVMQMEKLPGLVSIASGELTGATILVDGEEIGTTPLAETELSAGLHRLLVRAKNHLPHEQEIEITGMHVEQSVDVTLQPNWAPVAVSSQPAGATLSVDGETVGITPLTTEIEAGDRELTISLAGYKSEVRPITVIAGEMQTLDDVSLAVADGVLSVSTSPVNVNITVDGRFRGRSPIEIPVTPNKRHRIAFAKPGYESASRSVELEPDQQSKISVSLQPILGSVRIIASPADAELYVDGRASGQADQVLSLTAAPHTIEIRKTGYAPHTESVTPRRGLEQRLTVVLRTIAEAAAAELPKSITTIAGNLRLIRGGSLRMGSVRREQGRRSNEVRRDVELTREFYIGVTEVTNGAFRQFMDTHSSGFMGGITLNEDNQPVVRVSWQLAARFCNWLSDKDRLPKAYVDRDGRMVAKRPMNTGYRLPSEAEWSWVARFAGGAQPRKYVWGAELPPPHQAGNFADNAAGSVVAQRLNNYDDGFTVSAPVGSFAANPLGLTELAGNVTEWTHDYYEIATVDPFVSLVDPLGPQFGDQHVIRGASWMKGNISEIRSAFRDHGAQGRPDLGFRVARYAR